MKYRGLQAKIRNVKDRQGVEGRGGVIGGGYQPFLAKMVGMVRIKMYRFSSSDLFWM